MSMKKTKKADNAQETKPKRKYVRKAQAAADVQAAPKPKRKYTRRVKVEVAPPKHEEKPKRKYTRKPKVDVAPPKHVEEVTTPAPLPENASYAEKKAYYAATRAKKYAVDRRSGRWTKL
jgi:hypothetical protein